ncbi:MAG TPA: GGDEF domain-containing protein [Candidatus Limnocylindria bacterium]
MPPELIFLIVTAAVAVLLGSGAAVAALRARRDEPAGAEPTRQLQPASPADKYEPITGELDGRSGSTYATAVRVLWWVSIAAVLIGVGLSNAYDEAQSAIYIVGAIAVGAVVLLHDLLPKRFRVTPVIALEVLLAIGLTTALLVLTGYGTSPFVFGYNLVAVAVALALGGPMALVVATVASLAFVGVLAIDPNLASYSTTDLLRVGLQLGSIWLLAYVAGVFASGERRMRATVLQMSRTDALTGLYNRSQLFPTLEEEVQRTRRSERGFCLLMVDLDGLKAVNDLYGHHRGDEVLRLLGNVFRHSIRLVDTAYRYGGDEFLVLLPETDFAGAFVVAEKIRAGAEEIGLAVGGGELLTSVSIGLVSCPEDGTSAEELMIAADRAMYQAKSLGKNQVSGNPRPRRLVYSREPEPSPLEPVPMGAQPAVEQAAPAASAATLPSPTATVGTEPIELPGAQPPPLHPPPAMPPSPTSVAEEPPTPPPADRAVFSVEPEPGSTAATPAAKKPAAVAATNGGAPDTTEEEEADPSEVRRQIAAARRNMDPDHQIRRAMDAFLSPTRPNDPPN